VVVSGIGMVSGCGIGAAPYTQALWAGESALTPASHLPTMVGQVGPLRFTEPALKPFARLSPMAKFAILSTGEALGTATTLVRDNPRAGLFMSIISGAQRSTEKFMESVMSGTPELASAHHFPMTTTNASGGQVSLAYGIKGYNTTLCGAGSAFVYAHDVVRHGHQDVIAVTAADELTEILLSLYDHVGAILRTTSAEMALSGHSRGFWFGEGATTLVVESLAHARQRRAVPLAEVVAVAEAQDGKFANVRRDGAALRRVMSQCLEQAGVERHDIQAVFTAGMGAGRAAQAEVAALRHLFGATVPPLTCTSWLAGYGPSSHFVQAVAAAAWAIQQRHVPACPVSRGPTHPAPWLNTHLPLAARGLLMVIGCDVTGNCSAALLAPLRD
jgi:3-oxoacyl-[acyl-carrier-protein] synthase II